MDAISPVVKSVGRDNIFYFIDSLVLSYDKNGLEIIFYHLSFIENPSSWPKPIKKDNCINIALYHGAINGSKYDNDVEIEGHTDPSLFSDFDYVFLGDIHKRQFITNKMAYPGSLRQNNYGED